MQNDRAAMKSKYQSYDRPTTALVTPRYPVTVSPRIPICGAFSRLYSSRIHTVPVHPDPLCRTPATGCILSASFSSEERHRQTIIGTDLILRTLFSPSGRICGFNSTMLDANKECELETGVKVRDRTLFIYRGRDI